MRFKTAYNADEFPAKYEDTKGQPSKTVPDQSMSVREIMRRYAQGLPLDGARVPEYHGEDEYIPDLDKLDISERYDLVQENKDRISKMQIDLQEQEEKRKRKKQKDQDFIEFKETQDKEKEKPNPDVSTNKED